ncbi:MAG TPA: signal peptide peptidase SppA [Methylomirabilota bacterium]|nr:signal peptide peptidase SppA [Methylomirabilota bacterium]
MAGRLRIAGVALLVFLAVAGLFVIAVGGGARGAGGGPALFGPRVAIVELDGIIVDVDDIVRELKADRENPAVRAVVMRINSPGGVVGPSQELHDAVLRVRSAGKPVVASLGSVAASGGYYVAVACDQIYANPGTLTGSIGVIMQMANVEQLLKKVGVDYVVVKAGAYKDIGNISRPMSPEERRVLQTLLDDIHGQFIDAVAKGRKMSHDEVARFADGRVFSGQQAKDMKMVDALGGLEDAVQAAGKLAGLPSPPSVIQPKRHFSIMDLLRSEFGGSVAGALLRPALPSFNTPLYLME